MASHSKQVKDSELLVKDYLRVEGMIGVLKTMRADVKEFRFPKDSVEVFPTNIFGIGS
jgi:hypothetical protein